MKTKSLFLFSLFAALAIVSSCEKESVVTPPDKTPQDTIVTTIDTITCSSSIVIFPVIGGDTVVQIFAKENWKAEYNSPWINVTPQEAKGTRNITITVQPGEMDSTTISFCSKNDTTNVLIIRKGYRLPIVKTISPTNITTSSAQIRCELISNGGDSSTVYGICWGTQTNLDIDKDSLALGNSQTLTNLASNQVYYVRAFAKNEQGVAYGETLNFNTLDLGFSVNASKKVLFSHGNLMYNKQTNEWKFAENQYDYVGANNENYYRQNATGWFDIFPWSTHTVQEGNTYRTAFLDWGTHIVGTMDTWRTLTNKEWKYLFVERPNAKNKFSVGNINGTNGFIILPDNWVLPEGCSFDNNLDWQESSSINLMYTTRTDYYSHNSYSLEQWQLMEHNGAVFLPATGDRNESNNIYSIYGINEVVAYWSSTPNNNYDGYHIQFISGQFNYYTYNYAKCGYAVRLIKDL